jgi:PAS domain-containing protein
LERKSAELAEQREFFRVTLASIGDAVITTATVARITYLNPVAEAMTGWRSDDAIGKPLESVVSGDAFNLENPLALNPGYFIGQSGSPVLRALLTPLDAVTIWTLVLTAIGITCISKVRRGTAFAVVFGWSAVVVLARVALAAATS